MDTHHIQDEFAKLERESIRNRWINIVLGIVFVVGGFWSISTDFFTAKVNADSLFGVIGGALIGSACANWNGNQAHRLLRKVVRQLHETS